MLYISPEYSNCFAGFSFDDFFNLTGRTEKNHPGTDRHTFEAEIGGKRFVVKCHTGCGWGEIWKNLSALKKPVVSAVNEYRGLVKLPLLGLNTAPLAAFGERGLNPGRKKSFVITEKLEYTATLEDFVPRFFQSPLDSYQVRVKHCLTKKLAEIAGVLHNNGLNHQDFYLCHFRLDLSAGEDNLDPPNMKLYLMDLHRAQIRRKTPRRWLVKDIAGLWFSAMDAGLNRTDIFRFIQAYTNKSLRETLSQDSRFWKSVHRKACRLYKREKGECPETGSGHNL